MPAFCPNCWKELPPGKDDCPICGQRVTMGPYTGKLRQWSLNPYWQFDTMVAGLIFVLILIGIIAVLWLFLR